MVSLLTQKTTNLIILSFMVTCISELTMTTDNVVSLNTKHFGVFQVLIPRNS